VSAKTIFNAMQHSIRLLYLNDIQAYLRRLERKLAVAGTKRTAEDAMDDMGHLHLVLAVNKGAKKSVGLLETPSKTQAKP
jgi:hypothetical protein